MQTYLLIGGLYIGLSVLAFIAYAVDKSAARHHQWRIKESTLLVLGLFGGWPGAILAQQVFRHKSRKQSFQAAFWFSVAVNCGAVGLLLLSLDANALHNIGGPH